MCHCNRFASFDVRSAPILMASVTALCNIGLVASVKASCGILMSQLSGFGRLSMQLCSASGFCLSRHLRIISRELAHKVGSQVHVGGLLQVSQPSCTAGHAQSSAFAGILFLVLSLQSFTASKSTADVVDSVNYTEALILVLFHATTKKASVLLTCHS